MDLSAIETFYVVALCFTPDRERVVLLRKTHPTWQAGRFNGPGGKIEDGEMEEEALAREFLEETGMATLPSDWEVRLRVYGGSWNVAYGVLFRTPIVETRTDERVEVVAFADKMAL